MIIWKLTYFTCDETCTQHFLSRAAAETVSAQIQDIQEPKVEGIYLDRSTGFGSKARAVYHLNRLPAARIARQQT